MTVPSVFSHTLQETQIWLKELMLDENLQNEQSAYAALRAVLQHLRDRMTINEAAQLSAQLPMLIRGLYFEGWKPAATPVKERHVDQFIQGVRDRLHGHPEIDPEEAVRAVFGLLQRHVSAGETEDVRGILPKEIQALWPPASARAE